jgi:hypothetical protein
MIAVLQQLGITLGDVFMAGVAVGVLWTGRNRRHAGERVGKVEDDVAEIRGLLKALTGNGEQRK